MRIALDVREACKPRRSGKGQWVMGVLRELLRREVPLHVYSDRPLPSSLSRSRMLRESIIESRGMLWHLRTARAVRRSDAVAYVSPTSFIVPSLLGKKFPVIPVVHDLIALRDRTHERRAALIERLLLGRALKNARHVLTVSEATKRDLLVVFPFLSPSRVTPVFAGPLREASVRHVPDRRTILCAGTLSPRKNQLRLIRAYSELPQQMRSQYRLVLVGSRGWKDREIVDAARETPGVEWRSYVQDAEYESLLATCTVLAHPSLDEGFGLQVLDALQRGIPVLTSGRGSLREVCGNAAHVVDPENVSAIAAGLELLLTSDRVRFDLGARGREQASRFSWARTVDLLLEVLRKL